jgi:NTP pyrophosphatase (non-canonical NTP hydrolase)
MKNLEQLRLALRKFASDRDWEQFHTPKNLAAALSVEVAELQEIFMWLTPEQSVDLSDEKRSRVNDEVGDVFICLLNFCNRLGIDPISAAADKLLKNEAKYPVEKSRGHAKKYTDF